MYAWVVVRLVVLRVPTVLLRLRQEISRVGAMRILQLSCDCCKQNVCLSILGSREWRYLHDVLIVLDLFVFLVSVFTLDGCGMGLLSIPVCSRLFKLSNSVSFQGKIKIHGLVVQKE